MNPTPTAGARRTLALTHTARAVAAQLATAGLALAAGWLPAQAQTTAAAGAPAPRQLPDITITGNPIGATEGMIPAEHYAGNKLLLRAQSTLGETLDGALGVSSSYFGPNASRPIIRGQDGDRILVLQNSGASVDASGLSPDHAVPADPNSMERIEVLRGPGALLYGGSGVGGVINVLDNRIPREPLFDAGGGISGKLRLGLASGNQERSGAAMLETGTDRFSLHVDAFGRRAEDTAVPIALPCTKPGSPALANAICNASAASHGGAVGGAVFGDQVRFGGSLSSYRANYGTVAEDQVSIDMQSDRSALELDLNQLTGPFKSLSARWSQTTYEHTELESGVPGTVFKNRGHDLRLTARHADIGTVQGVVGVQTELTQFSADGSEAFAPYSQTRHTALFMLEELPLAWGRLSLGVRREAVQVESAGNPALARFVPGRRSFSPASAALGALWNLAPGWQLSSHLAYSERAPKDYELFADGPHLATNAYELGNANLQVERSTQLDLGVQWKQGGHSLSVSAFANRYPNYLYLQATGLQRDTDGNGQGIGVTDSGDGTSVESGATADILPEYAYTQVRARLHGLEASANLRLLDGAHTLDLGLRADLVKASNADTGEPLARIAPVRLGASLNWASGRWSSTLEARHAMAQTAVPTGDRSTAAYTLINAALGYAQTVAKTNWFWFAKVDNLTDTLAYPASSILTQTAPGKAPLPGRSLKLGLQISF